MTAGTTITGFTSSAPATLARNWWAVALRGGAAVLFGVLTIIHPGATLATLVLLFGVFALVDGGLSIVAGLRRREGGGAWGGLLLAGVLAITVGALTLWYPHMTGLFLLYLVAAWALVTGVGQIVAAVRLRREVRGEWLLGLSGLLSVLFGVALLAAPVAGALVIAVWIGAYALFAGVLLLALAFRLRGWARGGAHALAASR
ncbi:hypothetical protein tb265_05250 [Gemmatimonadetes bacterium T265]|nr:hypothetical protein tb265_05250 [Gemmatimonadetes bacterium T265]